MGEYDSVDIRREWKMVLPFVAVACSSARSLFARSRRPRSECAMGGGASFEEEAGPEGGAPLPRLMTA